MGLLDELRARRIEIRQRLEKTAVVGPLALSAIRGALRIWRRRFPHQPGPPVDPVRFRKLYAEKKQIEDLDQITDPVKKMHAEFALSTVERGRNVVRRFEAITTIPGKSYLDVGCAYGGFAVAFAEAGAKRIVGIDINPMLLECAEALLRDYHVLADLKRLDVLDRDRSHELGRFDLITCNDVIEHVANPGLALEHLAALLADGGTLYMEIPNRWAAPFVLSDGHYRFFGLTPLPKYRADRYARELGRIQDVTYKSLPYYINTLARFGLTSKLMESTPTDLPERFQRIAETFAQCERELAKEMPGVSAESKAAVERSVRRVARIFRHGHERYKNAKSSAEKYKLGRGLYLAFGADFWTLFIERRPSRPRLVSWSKEL